MKVLLAEDDEHSLAFLEAALSSAGYDVTATKNGEEALAAAKATPYDLIVSDILMPKMDGFDFCRSIKHDPALRNTPFVFYTATYIEERDRQLGLRLGADRYLVKPMDVSALLQELTGVLHAQRRPNATRHTPTSDSESPFDAEGEERLSAEQLAVVSKKLQKKLTELQRTYSELEASEARFQQLADNIQECFWMVDANDGHLIYGSPAMEQIWGFSAEQRIQSPDIWLQRIHAADRPAIEADYLQTARRGRTERSFRLVKPEGEVRWLRDRTFPVRNAAGEVYRIAGLTEDISESKQMAERLAYHANHDALTGLFNRSAFEQALSDLRESGHKQSTEHALCYVDLDQFKVINDTCGHSAGDRLLLELSELIHSKVRKTDTFARLGGDEFGVLMKHCSVEQAGRLAESIIDAVSAYRFQCNGASFSVGASIGLVMLGDGRINELAAADAACYVAKEQGGNRCHIYRDDDDVLTARRGVIQWVSRINEAFDDSRFELHFQGIHAIDSPRERPQKVEVLLRLRHLDGTLVTPGQFMPAAHRYQLAQRIDNYVIDRVCAWLAGEGAWVDTCAVNLSAPSLSDHAILETVRSALAKHNIAGPRICLEITETAALGNLSQVSELMHAVRELGCLFSVDDFGSGFSSFAYLKALPIDYLKIDGQFVVDIAKDPLEEAMVRSINDIGHAIGTKTVAEWVEDEETLQLLTAIGVDYAQGFHLSRPVPCHSNSKT